jgi:glycosyltransferase involved in cell wall biosynthesis
MMTSMDLLKENILRKQQKSAGSGINYEQFAPMPSQRNEDGKFVFLFISRLLKDKGTMEYVEAALLMEKYPHAEFHIVGPPWTGNKKSLTVTPEELKSWIEKMDYLSR